LFLLGSPFASRGTQNSWVLLFHPPYSPDLAPSDYHLFEPLKNRLRGYHHESDAVQETMRKWLQGAGTDVYRRGIFKIQQRWQKYIYWDGHFVEK
jgi:transposase